MSDNKNFETVDFSLLGHNFKLSCQKGEKEDLLLAVNKVKESTAAILSANPNLSPSQAAILVAVKAQSDLNSFVGSSTPFQKEAEKLTKKIRLQLSYENK